MNRSAWYGLLLIAVASISSGCAMVRSAATSALAPMAAGMAGSLQRQRDPDLVREGAPSLILLLDGLAAGSDRPDLLLSAARARIGYAAAFFGREEAKRAREMYAVARDQALAVLRRRPGVAASLEGPIAEFEATVSRLGRRDVPALYTAAMAWMGWILNSGGRPDALAQLDRPLAMMRRVLELDPGHDGGGPHLFFAIYHAVQPAGAGRDLEASRRHFERAFELAGPDALLPRVAYAEFHARYSLDRSAFERTLRTVIESSDDPPGLELMNAVARRRAHALLPMAEEWF